MDPLQDHTYALCVPGAAKNPPVCKQEPQLRPPLFNCTTSPPEPYKCFECGHASDTLLNSHFVCPQDKHKTAPTPRRYRCRQCGFATYSALVYLRHGPHTAPLVAKDHNYCEVGPEFETIFVTEEHTGLNTEEYTPETDGGSYAFHCHACYYHTNDRGAFDAHDHVVRDKYVRPNLKIFNCTKCPYQATRAQLQVHQRDKHPPETRFPPGTEFKCEGCAYVADTPLKLAEHVFQNDCNSTITYKCNLCKYETINITKYSFHILSKHGATDRFQCQQCPFRTGQIHVLRCHLLNKHPKSALVTTPTYVIAPPIDSVEARVKRHIDNYHAALKETNQNVAKPTNTNHGKGRRPLLTLYRCIHCSFLAKTVKQLTEHQAERHGNRRIVKRDTKAALRCTQYPFTTLHAARLERHLVAFHDTPIGQATPSPKPANRGSTARPPIVSTVPTRELVCTHCSFSTPSEDRLRCHIKASHSSANPDTLSPTTVQCMNGLIVRKPSKPYLVCTHCNFSTRSEGWLRRHMASCRANHSVPNPPTKPELGCMHCTFSTPSEARLRRHIAAYHAKAPPPLPTPETSNPEIVPIPTTAMRRCAQCSFVAKDASRLAEHMSESHLKCPECPHVSFNALSLSVHMVANHSSEVGSRGGDRAVRCCVCSFEAASQTALTEHRALQCAVCRFRTCDAALLRKHNERWHRRCAQCAFQCASQRELDRHVESNHRVEGYRCEGCEFRDPERGRIEEHIMREHTNAGRAFLCVWCGFKAKRRIDLEAHKYTEHAEAELARGRGQGVL